MAILAPSRASKDARRFWLLLVTALCGFGCASVKPYERARLAHPTMAPDSATSPAQDHVLAVQEGAAGGKVGAASGCGCN